MLRSVQRVVSTLPVLVLGLLFTAAAPVQTQPLVGESTTKVSDHVWAIMGFPNIAIIVGSRATLVVDTGLGPRNGATVARVAGKSIPSQEHAPVRSLKTMTWLTPAAVASA